MGTSWTVVPGMYGTYCKHCSLIPPLVFNNYLALLRCGYMCAGTLVYISRHLGKTSNNNNNNKRCQLCIVVCFVEYAFIGSYFGFSVLWLLYYTCSYPAFSLVFYSTSLLLLSYHTMSISCLISLSTCSCILVSTTRFSMHVYDSDLSIVLIYARHLVFASPLAGEFWLLWILMSRSWSLERVDSLSC